MYVGMVFALKRTTMVLNYALVLLIRLGNMQSAETEEVTWMSDEMFLISCKSVM